MTTLVELSRKGIYIITLRGLELQTGRLGSQDAQHWIQQWITGLGMPPPLPPRHYWSHAHTQRARTVTCFRHWWHNLSPQWILHSPFLLRLLASDSKSGPKQDHVTPKRKVCESTYLTWEIVRKSLDTRQPKRKDNNPAYACLKKTVFVPIPVMPQRFGGFSSRPPQ